MNPQNPMPPTDPNAAQTPQAAPPTPDYVAPPVAPVAPPYASYGPAPATPYTPYQSYGPTPPASTAPPYASYGPAPTTTGVVPTVPVPPAPPRYVTAGASLRMLATAVVAIVALIIASATLPPAVVAAKRAVFPKPAISIQASQTDNIQSGQSVTFTATASSGSQLSYDWSFTSQDGSPVTDSSGQPISATGPSTTQSFGDYGTFEVTVTATDPIGQTASASTQVSVLPPPPSASFTVSQDFFYGSNCAFDFDASGSQSSANIQDYSWDFGDGSQTYDGGTSSYVTYDYLTGGGSGTWTVTLTVTDEYNQTATTQQTVTATC